MVGDDPRDQRHVPDRREAPRRVEEVALHYAEVGLIAAALALVEGADDGVIGHYTALEHAVATYRAAESEAIAARKAAG